MSFVNPHLFQTTRDGFPALWGQAEIADYGEMVAEERYASRYPVQADGRRIRRRRVENWIKLAGFPDPVARLQQGPVYLVDEAAPWVEAHLARERRSMQKLPADKVKAVLADKGLMSENKAAAKHGVSNASVHRIWVGSPRGRRT